MYRNKDIDRLFREKFKDFEQQPSKNVWVGIENKLNRNQGFFTNKVKFTLIRIVGLVGVISILFFIGNKNGLFNNSLHNKIVNKPLSPIEKNVIEHKVKVTTQDAVTKINELPRSRAIEVSNKKIPFHFNAEHRKIDPKMIKDNELNNPNTIDEKRRTDIVQINKSQKSSIRINKNNQNLKKTNKKTNSIALITNSNSDNDVMNLKINSIPISKNKPVSFILKHYIKQQKSNLETFKPIALEERISIEKLLVDENKNSPHENQKWSVGFSSSPIYYGSLSKGSPIDSRIANSKQKSTISLSYGMKVSYKINKKWSLQTGINSLELAYKTKNVYVTNNLKFWIDEPLQPTEVVDSNKPIALVSYLEDTSLLSINKYGDLNQAFKYIEIPLELSYKLTHTKIDFSFVGGFSTLLLKDNTLFVEMNNNSYYLGKASNINKIDYSANLGVDIGFKVSKNWFMNISPSFKYHLNTFSRNSGGFKPYSVGVNTGLNYKF